METYQVGLIALIVFAFIGFLVYQSWTRKMRKHDEVIEAPQSLEFSTVGEVSQYVATVFAGRPLDRVLGHGLAHRGNATVLVSPDGVAIYRRGENSFLIPAKDVIGISQESTVIDRAVETDGLIAIAWNLGGTELQTYLRFVGASERTSALSKLKDLVV
ncbi:MAG: hypothetical protein WAO31_04720 [Rhodoluna sp.]